MSTVTLPRVQFKEFSLTDARTKLANQAATVLGYSTMARAIAAPGTLLTVLKNLGIEPLRSSSVAAYKASKVKHGMWSGTKRTLWLLAILGIFVTLAITALATTPQNSSNFRFGLNTGLVVTAVVLLFTTIGSAAGRDGVGHGTRSRTEWAHHDIAKYDRPIPEHILLKAIQIKEALPVAYIYVEQLEETEDSKVRPTPDPFLVVWHGTENYYIDVWDERDYEGLY